MYRTWAYTIVVLLVSCLPYNPRTPEKLPAPELSFVEIAIVSSSLKGYKGAVHLHWDCSGDETLHTNSFTLLRKLPEDSLFNVFSGSRSIPPDHRDFFDPLTGYSFPDEGTETIAYQILALDSMGNSGDTSVVCSVRVVAPPTLVSFTRKTGCFTWESWIRGGVFSWCSVWKGSLSDKWTSEEQLVFTMTDKPAVFSACASPFAASSENGTWYYALFIKANEAVSVTIGETDVQ